MKPASYYITKALEEILVQASEQPIQAADAESAIDAMNDLFLERESSGTPLGYTEVNGLGDDVTIPDYARRYAISNLAVDICIQYDVPVPIQLQKKADDSLEAVERIVVPLPINILPDTLAVGAGNECGGHYTNVFYPGDTENDVLTEQAGSILLEDGTVDDE